MPTEAQIEWCQKTSSYLRVFPKIGTDTLDRALTSIQSMLPKLQALGLKDEFDRLNRRFDAVAKDAQVIKSLKSGKKNEAKRIRSELVHLSHEIEMAVAEKDPLASPEVRRTALDVARYQAVYEIEAGRAAAAERELAALPATGEQLGQLTEQRVSAELLVPHYHEALQALNGWEDLLDKGRKAATACEKTAGDDDFRAARTEALAKLDAFSQVAGLAKQKTLQELEGRIGAALLKVAGHGKKRSQAEEAELRTQTVELQQIASVLKAAVAGQNTAAEQAAGEYDAVWKSMEVLLEDAPADTTAPLIERWRQAVALRGQQRYSEALTALKALKVDAVAEADTHAKALAAWTSEAEVVAPRVERATALLARIPRGQLQATTAYVSRLIRVWLDLATNNGLASQRHYTDALQVLKQHKVRAELKSFLASYDKLTDFSTAKEMSGGNEEMLLDAQVAALYQTKLEAPRASLANKLMVFAATGRDRAPLDLQLSAILARWQPLATPVLDKTAKVAARKAALKALQAAADKIERDILALAPVVPKLDPSLLKKLDVVMAAVKYLEGYGAAADDPTMTAKPSLAELKLRLDTLVAEVHAGADKALELQALELEAKAKRAAMDKALAVHRDAAKKDLEGLVDKVRNLADADKKHAAYYEGLIDGIEATEMLAGVDSLPVVLQAMTQAAALKKQVAGYETASTKKGPGPYKDATQDYDDALAEVVLPKGSDAKADLLPGQRAALKTKLEKVLKPSLDGLSPTEAVAAIATFRKDHIVPFQEALKKAGTASTALATQIAQARQALDALAKGPDAAACVKLRESMKARIDAAAKMPASSAFAAAQEIESVRVLIASARGGKAAMLEGRLEMQAFEAERDRQLFEADLDVFDRAVMPKVRELRDSVKKMGADRLNATRYAQVKTFREEAGKAKDKELATASEKLRLARATADAFLQNPYGPAEVGRRAVLGAASSWHAVAGEFRTAIEAVRAKIDALKTDPDWDKDQGESAYNAMAPLLTMFNPTQFEGVAKKVAQGPGADRLTAHRQSKENALMMLRVYRRHLAENAVLGAALDNPFGVAVPLARMRAVLTDLEGAFVAA